MCCYIYEVVDNAHYLNKYTSDGHNCHYYAKIHVSMYTVANSNFVIGYLFVEIEDLNFGASSFYFRVINTYFVANNPRVELYFDTSINQKHLIYFMFVNCFDVLLAFQIHKYLVLSC